MSERLHTLPKDMLDAFARKGLDLRVAAPQTGAANGVKVRRIMQMLVQFADKPVNELSVLDLGCGEGVYAIEAALRGARVLAIDGRTERMDDGIAMAERLGLTNVRFEQKDIRRVSAHSHGEFDVVFFLGILYHLDESDVFQMLANLHGLCRQYLFIDTHISLFPDGRCSHEGRTYRGQRVREHGDADSEATRRARVGASLDNTFAFLFDRQSLVRALVDAGFQTVVECSAPLEPGKPADRITLLAGKSEPTVVSTYPWINGKTESEVERFIDSLGQTPPRRPTAVTSLAKALFKQLGFEVRRTTKQ
jgi:SAM-dependent methyltransferase